MAFPWEKAPPPEGQSINFWGQVYDALEYFGNGNDGRLPMAKAKSKAKADGLEVRVKKLRGLRTAS